MTSLSFRTRIVSTPHENAHEILPFIDMAIKTYIWNK